MLVPKHQESVRSCEVLGFADPLLALREVAHRELADDDRAVLETIGGEAEELAEGAAHETKSDVVPRDDLAFATLRAGEVVEEEAIVVPEPAAREGNVTRVVVLKARYSPTASDATPTSPAARLDNRVLARCSMTTCFIVRTVA